MNEELLIFLWQFRLYAREPLASVEGEPIEVISVGRRNYDAGPDLTDVRLKIGGRLWAGNVEVHVKASDWLKHGHQHDPSYSNVILHLVHENDLSHSAGNFPTLALKNLISDQTVARYAGWVVSRDEIPCGKGFAEVDGITRSAWLERLLVERMEQRSVRIQALIDRCNGDLEQAFQAWFFRYLGGKVNADAFETLGLSIPWQVLGRVRENPFSVEAILFGMAGMIPAISADDYIRTLQKEFDFQAAKHGLQPMPPDRFRSHRIRPAGFPTLRLAQLADLLHRHGPLLSAMCSMKDADSMMRMLECEAKGYWADPSGSNAVKKLGSAARQNIIINAIVPFLFVRAGTVGLDGQTESILNLLSGVAAEENRAVRGFRTLGFKPSDSGQTQALLQLKAQYCDLRKCLSCAIGARLLHRSRD